MKFLQNIILIFSVSLSFSISAQRIVSKRLSFEEVLMNEQALKSENITEDEDLNGEMIIYSKGDVNYPYGASFHAPIEFKRSISDFHIKPQTSYYFDSQKKKLLFFVMNWNVYNTFNIFSKSYLSDSHKALEEENGKKPLYKSFYIKLNKAVAVIFGEPTKRSKVKDWEVYNSDGWRYEWITETYKVTTELRMPKDGYIDFIYINYTIAWK